MSDTSQHKMASGLKTALLLGAALACAPKQPHPRSQETAAPVGVNLDLTEAVQRLQQSLNLADGISQPKLVPLHIALEVRSGGKSYFRDVVKDGEEIIVDLPIGEVEARALVLIDARPPNWRDFCGLKSAPSPSPYPSPASSASPSETADPGNQHGGTTYVAAVEQKFSVTQDTSELGIRLGDLQEVGWRKLVAKLPPSLAGKGSANNARIVYADAIARRPIIDPCSGEPFSDKSSDDFTILAVPKTEHPALAGSDYRPFSPATADASGKLEWIRIDPAVLDLPAALKSMKSPASEAAANSGTYPTSSPGTSVYDGNNSIGYPSDPKPVFATVDVVTDGTGGFVLALLGDAHNEVQGRAGSVTLSVNVSDRFGTNAGLPKNVSSVPVPADVQPSRPNPPNSPPLAANAAPTDLTLSATSISENAGSYAIVGTLTTIDPDAGSTFTYSFSNGTGDADNKAFFIDGVNLQMIANADFETKNSYSVRIRSTDAGGLIFEKAFSISITNADEPTLLSLADSTDRAVAPGTTSLSVTGITLTDPNGNADCSKILAEDWGTKLGDSRPVFSTFTRSIGGPSATVGCSIALALDPDVTGYSKVKLSTNGSSSFATFGIRVESPQRLSILGSSAQRRSFYDSATQRHWGFFADRTNADSPKISVEHSIDGKKWIRVLSIPGPHLNDFSVVGKDGKAYLAATTATSDMIDIYAITLSTSAPTYSNLGTPVAVGPPSRWSQPSLALDQDGRIWIAAARHQNGSSRVQVWKSVDASLPVSTTWTLTSNAPALERRSGSVENLALISRGAPGMLLLVGGAGGVDSFAWNGSEWSAVTGTPENLFNVTGSGLSSPNGTSGKVNSIIEWNGQMIVAGEFVVPGTPIRNIAHWTGTSWSPMGAGFDLAVNALAVDTFGNLYAGGAFTASGTSTGLNRVAMWNGSNWQGLGSGISNGVVNALATDGAGNIFAGGEFTLAGTVTANNLAKWNRSANGNAGNWESVGSGAGGPVYSLAAANSGQLFVGGSFTSPAKNIAQWNPALSGGLGDWVNMGNGTGANGTVRALIMDPLDGFVYAGGNFTSIGGAASSYLSRCSIPCASWQSLSNTVTAPVTALAWSGDSGSVFVAYGVTAGGYQIQKRSGSTLTNVASTLQLDSPIAAIGVTITPLRVYIGGAFTKLTSTQAALWLANTNGSNWEATGNGFKGKINAVAADSSPPGSFVVAGEFTSIAGVRAWNVARWNSGQGEWQALSANSGRPGTDGPVFALKFVGQSLHLGGDFTAGDTRSCANNIKVHGSTWSCPGPLASPVYSLASNGSNLLFAAGAGDMISGKRVAFLTGEEEWSELGGSGDIGSGSIRALEFHGGSLYAGGEFTTPAQGIAKRVGTGWTSLTGGGIAASGSVWALASAGANLYVGGSFTGAGASVASNIAQWNGSSWSKVPGSGGEGTSGKVSALAWRNGRLYVGGEFTSVAGANAKYLASWDPTNALWRPESESDTAPVYALAQMTDAALGNPLLVGTQSGAFQERRALASYSDTLSAAGDATSGNVVVVTRQSNAGTPAGQVRVFAGSSWGTPQNLPGVSLGSLGVSLDPVSGAYGVLWSDGSSIRKSTYSSSNALLTTSELIVEPSSGQFSLAEIGNRGLNDFVLSFLTLRNTLGRKFWVP